MDSCQEQQNNKPDKKVTRNILERENDCFVYPACKNLVKCEKLRISVQLHLSYFKLNKIESQDWCRSYL